LTSGGGEGGGAPPVPGGDEFAEDETERVSGAKIGAEFRQEYKSS